MIEGAPGAPSFICHADEAIIAADLFTRNRRIQILPMTAQSTDFSNINQSSAQSFKAQKNLIKQLLAGKKVPCPKCQQALSATLPPAKSTSELASIRCPKGCTDIELETELPGK
ncbi:hypothetical protein GCM10007107_18350 [Shewanella indica]|nr:hypothetical protein GCM10007107_18350 [Shewanella indica]